MYVIACESWFVTNDERRASGRGQECFPLTHLIKRGMERDEEKMEYLGGRKFGSIVMSTQSSILEYYRHGMGTNRGK